MVSSSQAAVSGVAPKQLQKRLKGTNITIRKDATDGIVDAHLAMLHAVAADDATEVMWFNQTLRPSRNLAHPTESFVQGIKALRPAALFNTFDVKKLKLRRLTKQQKDKTKALKRRKVEVAPTAAYRAAINPRKVPRTGGHATEEEIRFLSRGTKKKTTSTSGKDDAESKKFFTKWRKQKAERIGKGL